MGREGERWASRNSGEGSARTAEIMPAMRYVAPQLTLRNRSRALARQVFLRPLLDLRPLLFGQLRGADELVGEQRRSRRYVGDAHVGFDRLRRGGDEVGIHEAETVLPDRRHHAERRADRLAVLDDFLVGDAAALRSEERRVG